MLTTAVLLINSVLLRLLLLCLYQECCTHSYFVLQGYEGEGAGDPGY